MFDQYPQFAPLSIDPRQPFRPPAAPGMLPPPGGLDPLHHAAGGIWDAPPPAQPAPAPPAPDLLSRYNQYLANQGTGGTLNLDPNNPGAGIQTWGRSPDAPAGGAGLVASSAPPAAAAQPKPAFNPKQTLSPSQGGYIDYHASTMGTTPDQLRQMLGANPELGTMLARNDASRQIQGEHGADLLAAAGGDPGAVARILNPGQGGMGLSGGQNARVLETMNRQNLAGLEGRRVGALEKEVGIKEKESGFAQRQLEQKQREAIASEIDARQKMFPGESVDVSRAQVEKIRGMKPGSSLVGGDLGQNAAEGGAGTPGQPAAAGPIAGLPPIGQQPAGGPAMSPQLEALLNRYATGLAPGLNGKPGMSLPDLLVAYNKQNAATPGFGAANLKAMTNFINSKYGENALLSHLSGAGVHGGEIGDLWSHIGIPSERTAADDVFRNSLGIQRGRSIIGELLNMGPLGMATRLGRGDPVLAGWGG